MPPTNEQQGGNANRPPFMPNGPFNIRPQRGIRGHSQGLRGQDQGIWQITNTANAAAERDNDRTQQPMTRQRAPGRGGQRGTPFYGGYGLDMQRLQQMQHQATPIGGHAPQVDYGPQMGAPAQEAAHGRDPTDVQQHAYGQHLFETYGAPQLAPGYAPAQALPYGQGYPHPIFVPQHGNLADFRYDATAGEPPVPVAPGAAAGAGRRDSNASVDSNGSIAAQVGPRTRSAPASISGITAPPVPDRDANAPPPPPPHTLSATAPTFHPISTLPPQASELREPEKYYRDYVVLASNLRRDLLAIHIGPEQELPANKASETSCAKGLDAMRRPWQRGTDVELVGFPGLLSCERTTGGRPIASRMDLRVAGGYHNFHTGIEGKMTILRQGNADLQVLPEKMTDLECREHEEMWEEGASSAVAAARRVLMK